MPSHFKAAQHLAKLAATAVPATAYMLSDMQMGEVPLGAAPEPSQQ
jgi:hypothetical protein